MSAIHSHNDTYSIIQLIGEGVYGEVTCCCKRSTGQFVAIKTVKYDSCSAAEVRMLKLLQDMDADKFHIVNFLECFHRNAKSYLVFELLEQNLQDFQKANNFAPLPVKHVRTIAMQLLKALEKLKDLSIIHTDIKPDNIMLVEHMRFPFRVKVIDFGSASLLPEVQHIQDPYIQARYYRSPEILLGLPFCEKLDMWSLGCVLAELRLGKPLYPGKNQYDQIRIIVETQGQPHDHLLNQASKTHLFFKRNSYPSSAHQWQLKSLSEYQSKMFAQPLEPRRHNLKSLDELEIFSIIETLSPNGDDIAEFHDRNSMLALVKRMLNFDPKNRISPRLALQHPFITMEELEKNHKDTKYYELSVQSLDAALNYVKTENNKNNFHLLQNCNNSSTVHRESTEDQCNHSYSFGKAVVDKRDNVTFGKSRKNMMPPGGKSHLVHEPFSACAGDARRPLYPYQETCHQIYWSVHRHVAESTPGNPTNPLLSDHSFSSVIQLDLKPDKDRNSNKHSIVFPLMKGQENGDNKPEKYPRSSITEENQNKEGQIKETTAVHLKNSIAKENNSAPVTSYTHSKCSVIKASNWRDAIEVGFIDSVQRYRTCPGTKQHLEPGMHVHKKQNSISTRPRHIKDKPGLIVSQQEELNSDQAEENVKSGTRRIRSRSRHIPKSEITSCKANKLLLPEDCGEDQGKKVHLENIHLKQITKRHDLSSETEINSPPVEVNEAEDLEKKKILDKNTCGIFKLAKFQSSSKKIQKEKKVTCWG
ncbi:homeodomain-interacting protein kinase 4-like [Chiloscyllium plagiosum]|uniref:homeodomain-interacting protein kinase 4-like n=1 Tax=Chiloscyllium plagiosum TaxID=36176 RepID=UPI001CB80C05|nr:homeodomain-interacting protein kinase 4-like [Chiloscyllium plagiosum]